jgi:hypothetical protein
MGPTMKAANVYTDVVFAAKRCFGYKHQWRDVPIRAVYEALYGQPSALLYPVSSICFRICCCLCLAPPRTPSRLCHNGALLAGSHGGVAAGCSPAGGPVALAAGRPAASPAGLLAGTPCRTTAEPASTQHCLVKKGNEAGIAVCQTVTVKLHKETRLLTC